MATSALARATAPSPPSVGSAAAEAGSKGLVTIALRPNKATSAGTDVVRTSLASYTLGANVENLTGTGSGQTLTGNALANTLSGGANETLAGAGGYDTYRVGTGMGHTTVNNTASERPSQGRTRSSRSPAGPRYWAETPSPENRSRVKG